ncbi:MAG: glycosyltransferase family 4 protein [Coriobacteriia bacterium]
MRVLFATETSSIHSARWINQLRDFGWDVHAYQTMFPGLGVSPNLELGTVWLPFDAPEPEGVAVRHTISGSSMAEKVSRHSAVVSRAFAKQHARRLSDLILDLKPDVIHSVGLNIGWVNQCLPVLHARERLGRRFSMPWIYSSFGSDLAYFPDTSPERKIGVEQVVRSVDYYIAECERDVRLADEMGFRGEHLGSMPAFGGADVDYFSARRSVTPPASRRTIFLKGTNQGVGGDPIGRAMTAMRAFKLCERELAGYRIVIGSASPSIREEAAVLAATTQLDIHVLPYLTHDAIVRIIGSSRIMVSLTVMDGLPSVLVEAMAVGALPLHSHLEPITEWIEDGKNGLLVPPEDPEAVAAALRQALGDDELVDAAADMNAQLVAERLSIRIVGPRVKSTYETVAENGPTLARA